jgi:hypothetical protein
MVVIMETNVSRNIIFFKESEGQNCFAGQFGRRKSLAQVDKAGGIP